MTDLRSFLADQLRRVHQGGAWHGPSLAEALEGVDHHMAVARPLPGAHSIHALTHHVTAWTGEVLQRLGGREPQAPDEGDFPPVLPSISDTAWALERAKLDRVHAQLVEAILALDPKRLHERMGDEDNPPLGTGHTIAGMLNGLVQHDAYHAGQILLLKRGLLAAARRAG